MNKRDSNRAAMPCLAALVDQLRAGMGPNSFRVICVRSSDGTVCIGDEQDLRPFRTFKKTFAWPPTDADYAAIKCKGWKS